MSTPSPVPLPARRSARIDYTSNGRNYLCSVTGWPREKLDEWLTSNSVRSHLQIWYCLCVSSKRRFNDAIEWINTRAFYEEGDLEEDLLLMCLQEGNMNDADGNAVVPISAYADNTVATSKWITQEVWARAAWRVVQDNAGPGEAFEKAIQEHPAAAYALAIDILCLAFHSIAYREADSVWEGIITNGANMDATPPSPEVQNDFDVDCESDVDMDVDVDLEGNISSNEGMTDDNGSDDDADFIEVAEPVTPKSKRPTRKSTTPKAPKKEDAEIGENIVVGVKGWMNDLSEEDEMQT
ncbi:hypothetical protein M409DRAFT_21642 [Zasmidium cellare ATCC 36951]|uniref:Uncharacterized protein n=1 Tax=Zasmidium cellare ATCC 36951 TaxID=1080233 RepID=A0A6A6CPN7_ZASCE|nr:uncharacterized protein M409DRAFT_21642 [Zasmidium cellare ATCC 36951]KAF2168198.1 hypothetical protein M409DRAFT_21642 [Zasmidium cellare ATCC 36951]